VGEFIEFVRSVIVGSEIWRAYNIVTSSCKEEKREGSWWCCSRIRLVESWRVG
jgi:hypothetical protein